MKEITVTELSRGLSEFINRATYLREFLVMRGGKAVAALSPVPTGGRICDLERTLSELPRLAPEDVAEFELDLADVRNANNEPLTGAWPSS